MTGKTHLLIGIAAGVLFSHSMQPQPLTTALIIGAAAIGSLLPDVDSPESTINRLIPPLMLVSLFFKHRGILHSIFIPMLIFSLGGFAAAYVGLGAGALLPIVALSIGYASHILADACTISGVPLWPMPFNLHLLPRPFRLLTGGIIENLLALALVLGMVYYLYMLQPYRLPL